MTFEDIKSKWSSMICEMLETYRKENPLDKQSDDQIIKNFMENFVKKGLIEKKNGKYILNKLSDDESLV